MSIRTQTFRFGQFELDTRRQRLLARGTPVELGSKSFAILELLIRSPDRVFSKEELLSLVWPGIAVTPNSVTVAMSSLRRALADEGADDDLIVTIPGRGYKFGGDVSDGAVPEDRVPGLIAQDLPPAMPALPRTHMPLVSKHGRWASGLACAVLIVAAVVIVAVRGEFGLTVTPRLSIAVLPFRSLGPDRTKDYLAVALTEDLSTDLSHIPGSVVRSRDVGGGTEPPEQSARDAGTTLHVRYVLQGSLLMENHSLSVNAQLVDTRDGRQLWAERFVDANGETDGARVLIEERIASALGFALEHLEASRSLHDRPNNPDALDDFLRARAILDSDDSLAGLTRAQHLLEKALTLEPDFGDALAELGQTLLRKTTQFEDPNDAQDFARAKELIDKALAVSASNIRALSAKAKLAWEDGRYSEAEATARRAVDIAPGSGSAHAVLFDCLMRQGKLDEAVPELETVIRLDPESPLVKRRYLALGQIRLLQGRWRDAIGLLNEAISGDPQPRPGADSLGREELARIYLIAALALDGQVAQAQKLFTEYNAIWPNRSAWRLRAFYPAALLSSPNLAKIVSAWHLAGMPLYIPEASDSGVSDWRCDPAQVFTPTPLSIPGVRTAPSSEVERLVSTTSSPLVIDLGHGLDSPPGARVPVPSDYGDTAAFALKIAKLETLTAPNRIIILMGDGVFGCDAYQSAEALIKAGYVNILWYRGGEENWAAKHGKF